MPVWSSLVGRLPSLPADWISHVRDWTSVHKTAVSLTAGAAGLLVVTLLIRSNKVSKEEKAD